MKTIAEINERIKNRKAVVVTAEEIIDLVEEKGVKKAAQEVDVVTTGTFGPMCSSGMFINFGHPKPGIKMTRTWLNDVPAFSGLAAVDAYVGATEMSERQGMQWGRPCDGFYRWKGYPPLCRKLHRLLPQARYQDHHQQT